MMDRRIDRLAQSERQSDGDKNKQGDREIVRTMEIQIEVDRWKDRESDSVSD
jgi:hypothetical protein